MRSEAPMGGLRPDGEKKQTPRSQECRIVPGLQATSRQAGRCFRQAAKVTTIRPEFGVIWGNAVQPNMTSRLTSARSIRLRAAGFSARAEALRRLASAAIVMLAATAALTALTAAPPADAAARQARPARSTEAAAPREAGEPIMAIVSIKSQQVTFYDADGWILRAPVSTGTTGRETPAGVFAVVEKDKDHHSSLYDDAWMPNMQRITWSGIALHGGPLPGYAASHGCIRMPYDFAEKLFDKPRIGMRVIISPSDAEPVEFSYPTLFVPKQEMIDAAPAHAEALAREADEATKAAAAAKIAVATARRQTAKADQKTKQEAVAAAKAAAKAAEAKRIEVVKAAKDAKLALEPVSVFISRTTQKLYVRRDTHDHLPDGGEMFDTTIEVPIAIKYPNKPIGTHIFTAVARTEGGLRWTEVTIDNGDNAKDALDRITIPQEVLGRIAPTALPRSSIIISDEPPNRETNYRTEFVVVLNNQPQGGLAMRRPPVEVQVARPDAAVDDGWGFYRSGNWDSQNASTRQRGNRRDDDGSASNRWGDWGSQNASTPQRGNPGTTTARLPIAGALGTPNPAAPRARAPASPTLPGNRARGEDAAGRQ
jgi:lipoprotein-anchoring transpeptidase ErfK/SrfK